MSDKNLFEAVKLYEDLIRCKDCKHFRPFPGGTYGSCNRRNFKNIAFKEDDFCSYSERKATEKPAGWSRSSAEPAEIYAIKQDLEKALEVIDAFGRQICEDPLLRPCTDCIRQFECSETSRECEFRWTYADEAERLLRKDMK